MPTQRSPPSTSKQTSNRVKSQTEPKPKANETDNTTNRSKRQRLENSPGNPENLSSSSCICNELKVELIEMLNSWKNDHDQRLTNWKTEQDAILSLLAKDVSELKLQCSVIQKTTQELENSMAYINKDYEEMEKKVSELENQNTEKGKSISHLQKQIQDLNLQFRPATIELRNVPVKENEKPEDLVAIMSGVGKAIDLDINKSNLRDIYRLPGKPGTSRSIVAEFTKVSDRNDFLSSVKQFNKARPLNEKLNTQTIGLSGQKLPIYAAEHLTPSMRKLFYDCRQYAKTHNFFCWSVNGRILMKIHPDDKPIQITSENCLSALKNKE